MDDSLSTNNFTVNVESNPCSPYFLTTVNHPSVLLVIEKLSNNNCHSWSHSIFLSLKAQNKFGFIDGSHPVPNTATALFSFWSKWDTIVFSWLLNSLSSKIAQSFVYIDSSRAMWVELKEHFSQGNGSLIF